MHAPSASTQGRTTSGRSWVSLDSTAIRAFLKRPPAAVEWNSGARVEEPHPGVLYPQDTRRAAQLQPSRSGPPNFGKVEHTRVVFAPIVSPGVPEFKDVSIAHGWSYRNFLRRVSFGARRATVRLRSPRDAP